MKIYDTGGVWPLAGGVTALVLVGFVLALKVYAGRLDHARSETETARDAGVAKTLEAEGEKVTTGKVAVHHHQVRQAEEAAHALDREAAKDPGAAVPLPDGVRDRLRRHDGVLCGLRPAVCAAGPGAQASDAP